MMLRQYDEKNPATYMTNTTGDDIEMIVLPLGLREKYLEKISEAKTTKETIDALSFFVKSINGEPPLDVLRRASHLYDIKELYEAIVAESWMPEDVSKNSQPLPESSNLGEGEGVMKTAAMEGDNVSITRQP